jgi:hypothetical protein
MCDVLRFVCRWGSHTFDMDLRVVEKGREQYMTSLAGSWWAKAVSDV